MLKPSSFLPANLNLFRLALFAWVGAASVLAVAVVVTVGVAVVAVIVVVAGTCEFIVAPLGAASGV